VNRTLLFVYGTLLSGERSHALLAGSEPAGPARTAPSFRLSDCGDYPALRRGGTSAVEGELYWISDATLAVLDDFEGHPDLFQRSPVALIDGREAYAYLAGVHAPPPRCSIPDGNWRAWRARAR
jgi:gamma-glutamylcyclotransferase (GGCT)/AIG2-like uncharacterized protein YtfP